MTQTTESGGGRPPLVDRLGDGLTRVCLAVAAAALLCIVVINGANVLARYVFVAPFSWAEEAMLFLMILSVFAGAIAVTWRNMHIRIDTFVDLAPPAIRRVIMAIGTLVSVVSIAVIVYASANIISILRQLDQRSDALELPSWMPQSFLTVGLAIVALLMAVRTVLSFTRPQTNPSAQP